MNTKNILLAYLSLFQTCLVVWGGDMYVLGLNSAGQLGDGRPSTTAEPVLVAEDVVDVSMGDKHSLFIKRNGSLWGMGDNIAGQLGLDPFEIRSTPYPLGIAYNMQSISAGGYHSLAINALGQLFATGADYDGQTGLEEGDYATEFGQVAPGVLAVSAGGWHSLFIKPDSRSSPGMDPTGPESGSDRVIRGGDWDYGAIICRLAFRNGVGPSGRYYDLGFRLSRR